MLLSIDAIVVRPGIKVANLGQGPLSINIQKYCFVTYLDAGHIGRILKQQIASSGIALQRLHSLEIAPPS